MNKTYVRKGRIFIIILLFFMMCGFQSIGNTIVQQKINDDYFSEENLQILSELRFPDYADQELKTQNAGDEVNFFGQSNSSCYIVKVSSSKDIYLDNFEYDIQISLNDKRTSGACALGVFITNKSWITTGIAGGSEANFLGNLRFVHLKFGKINYTYENRIAYNRTGNVVEKKYKEPQKPILPPGTWYFIYFGCLYDLPQEDTIVKTSVWIDFTGDCTDLRVSSYDDGRIFDVWYGEFDANIIFSKAWRFEMMINGRARFPVNNTFIYSTRSWPFGTGFWKLKLITPDNIYKLNMLILREYHFPDIDFDHKCMKGLEDKSGDYELQVNYIDIAPFFNKYLIAFPTYFIGLDVNLR